MLRLMLDTNQPEDLGVGAEILATYADLHTPALEQLLRLRHGQVVWIDRGLGDPAGISTVLDVEQHAEGPAAIPGWFDSRRSRGMGSLTVYANRDTMPSVDAAAGGRGIYRWIARLDGQLAVPGFLPGRTPAAVQVLGSAALGFHADLSVVQEDRWHPALEAALTPAGRAALESARTLLDDALAALARVQ
jgi:hypothetical protein